VLFARECVLEGFALAQQGSLNEAILLFREALQWQPDCADAYYNLASALTLQGSFEDAAAGYLKVLEINPGHPYAAAGLGHVADARKAQGDLPGAINCYRQLLRFQPSDALIQYKLALAMGEQDASAHSLG
jgi:tetratricopeptide (TPR) repeat protein